ncbi:MAG: DNA repair helicase, partial [Thermoproteota archaeon]|nr:DNA repair helicase [Thermoproteota archaeon]
DDLRYFMDLRSLKLKEQYRTDKDNIIADFFIPCLSNCIQFDRAIEYVTLQGLSTLSLGFHNSTPSARIRMITGHQFKISDLNTLSKIFIKNGNSRINFNPELIRDVKLELIRKLFTSGNLMLKVGIPSSEDIDGTFSEKVGIFQDANGDAVAFSGSSNVSFDRKNKSYESIDVFTSWNDKTRVDAKKQDFENLWSNETKSVSVYDFEYAEKHNLLKYSSEWAVNLN